MKAKIVAKGLAIGSDVQDYVARRLSFALDRSRHHIQSVTVRLMDLNGPRGGSDKLCRIQLAVPGHAPLVVSATSNDLKAAIDGAAHRVSRSLARSLNKAVRSLRHGPRLAGPELDDALPAA